MWAYRRLTADAQARKDLVRRGAREVERLLDVKWLGLLTLLVVILIVSTVVVDASAADRWPLYGALLLALSVKLVLVLYETSSTVPALGLPLRRPPSRAGAVQILSDTLSRADRGLRYSQALVALRLRDAFLEKVKSRRGLNEDDLDSLLEDPAALESVVGNAVIARFLSATSQGEKLLHTPTDDERPLLRTSGGEPYSASIGRIVTAMEAWE